MTKGEVRIDDESYGFISDIKDFESYLQKWVDGLV